MRDIPDIEEALTKRGVTPWLVKFGWAPGFYTGKCIKCDDPMMGDKRARVCLPCAIKAALDVGDEAQTEAWRQGRVDGRRELARQVQDLVGSASANAVFPKETRDA